MEYDLKLIINVNEINSIVPNYEVRKPSSQNIEVVLSESKEIGRASCRERV